MQTNRMFVNPRSYKSTATVWLLLVTISVQFVFSKPVQKYSKSQTVISTLVDANLPTYLTKFGYLSESDSETGNLRTDEQLRNALEELQKFGNIPVTGQLDEATKQLIRKPRCGVPDTLSGQHRSKRYTLHGQKWQKVNLTWR